MNCPHKQAEEKSPSMRTDLNTSAYSYFDASRREIQDMLRYGMCCLTQIEHTE